MKRVYVEHSGNASEDQVFSGLGKFIPSKKVTELRSKLIKFMEDHIYPVENEFYKLAQSSLRWTVHPEEERLKELAKKEGLWNLWIPVCVSILLPSHALLNFVILEKLVIAVHFENGFDSSTYCLIPSCFFEV